MFSTLPTRFRHYEVLKLLGGGGFGVVYLARDTNLKRLVVLKTLHPHLAAQPDMRQRFVLEARAMARLDHVNIVRVNQVQDDPSSRSSVRPMPFFEMEYVEGQTLANYRGSRTLSLQEAMPLLKQMAAALDAAHQQKIVHRDVKPANVLVKPDGQLKLTDFGIIKLLEVTGTALPSTGGIIGTPSYMAPEQANINRKHEIGPATDIYALGVVTYELLTGRRPFEHRDRQALLSAHVRQAPPDPRTFNRYLSQTEANALLKALAKEPANRYPSAMAFVESLEPPAWGPPPTDPSIPSITDSFRTASGGGAANIGQSIDHPSKIPWPMIIGLVFAIVMACIIGLVLRPFIAPEPESGVVLVPTEAPQLLTATSVSLTATSVSLTVTSVPPVPPVPPTATPMPPTATPSSQGSTIVGQDGMRLLYVPEGEFLMGSKEDDPDARSNEQPQRLLYLDAFWIDETEVTNEMFLRFVDQTGYQTGAEKEGTGYVCLDGSCDYTGGADWRQPNGSDSNLEGLEQHPVVQMNWNDAKAYCEWAGRRLPTEAEWEKAARGPDGRTYPWGNEDITGNRVNFCDRNCSINSIDDGYPFAAPVGSYPAGASPYGALDMAGNVWEWAADWYDADYYKKAPENRNLQGPATGEQRVLRGGSWYYGDARAVRAAFRFQGGPAASFNDWGFRCARSP